MNPEDLDIASSLARGTRTRVMRKRVLLAEDNAPLRHLIGDSLRRSGYDVVEVTDGAEALEWIGAHLGAAAPELPDIAVADIRMPYLSGLQVLAALRDVQPAFPIILMTAFGDEDTHSLARRLGAVAVFDKPFPIDDLCAAVADALAANAPRCAIPQRRHREIHVLVVDPSDASGAALAEILADDGYAASHVSTRGDAIAATVAHPPDVVVIDIDSLHGEADEVLAALKAIAPGLTAIIVTGSDREDAEVALLRRVCRSAYVRKPIDTRLLSASILRLVSASRRAERELLDAPRWRV
jgi:DNA-binding response OmpR family regulator